MKHIRLRNLINSVWYHFFSVYEDEEKRNASITGFVSLLQPRKRIINARRLFAFHRPIDSMYLFSQSWHRSGNKPIFLECTSFRFNLYCSEKKKWSITISYTTYYFQIIVAYISWTLF
jgi:hypothetical protein